MVNGKAKGAAFERSICVKLSLWVSHGKHEDCFWRASMSGGRSTVAARRGKRLAAQAGDISCIHPIGAPLTDRFYLECKSYLELNFAGLLTGKGNLVNFWAETVIQSRNYHKEPLLIAHQNRYPTMLCTSEKGAWLLKTDDWLFWAPKLDLWIASFEDVLKQDFGLKNMPP